MSSFRAMSPENIAKIYNRFISTFMNIQNMITVVVLFESGIESLRTKYHLVLLVHRLLESKI